MTEQELISVQDSFFDMAKSLLLQRGYCHPLGFVVTGAGGENGVSEGSQFSIESIREPAAGVEPDYSIIAFDMEPPDDVLLKQLCVKYLDKADKIKEAVRAGIEIFGFTVEESFTRTLDVLLDYFKVDRKQIVVWMAQELCEKTKAFAFIHICEGYGLSMENEEDRKNYPKRLADHPESREILLSMMDGFNFRRNLTLDIHREPAEPGKPRDSGKIISLGEIKETIDKGDGDNKLRGRFVEILPQVD